MNLSDLTDRQRLEMIAAIAKRYETDENLGDSTERIETILWVATAGLDGADLRTAMGRDWGHTQEAERAS